METKFTTKYTNIIKGCAVMLLLFHHLFYKMEFFDGCFTFCQSELIFYNMIARLSKVCVAIFLILSGYGLTVSANKATEIITWRFSQRHIVKLMINFWVIYLLFVPLGFVLGRNPVEIYGAGVTGIGKFFMDFFGIAYLTNGPTFNATWWFMGEILRLYILFPLMYYGVKNNLQLLFFVGFVMCFFYNLFWFLPFICGMIISEKDCFNWYLNLNIKKKGIVVLVLFLPVPFRLFYGVKIDAVFALWIITVVLLFIKPEKIFGKIFEVLGKHSGNIFMLHTFIYYYYFKDFIYSFRHPIIIFLILLLVCLGISWMIEQVKHILKKTKTGGWFCQSND